MSVSILCRKKLILIFLGNNTIPWQPSCSGILQEPGMLVRDLVASVLGTS